VNVNGNVCYMLPSRFQFGVTFDDFYPCLFQFSKFLQQMETEGFIRLKEVSKGVDAIVEIDRSHPE